MFLPWYPASIATMIHLGPGGYKEMSSILADQ